MFQHNNHFGVNHPVQFSESYHMAACTYRVLAQSQYKYKTIFILMVTEALEMGVGNGYPPEFYNLGVSQGASLLAALTRLIITDTETSTSF